MPEISLIPCETPAELFCHYQGQHNVQGAFVALDLPNGTLCADYDPIGNGIPKSVYDGQVRRYPVPVLTADAANRLLSAVKPFAQRILDDWDEDWNGHDYVALLGKDALKAEDEIRKLTYEENFGIEDQVQEIDPGDWFTTEEEIAELGITEATTDEQLDEITARVANEAGNASDYGYTIIGDLGKYLQNLRQAARAEAKYLADEVAEEEEALAQEERRIP